MTYEEVISVMQARGYHVHSHDGQSPKKWACFIPNNHGGISAMVTQIGTGEEKIEISTIVKMFCAIATPKFSFSHPDFKRFEETILHYKNIADRFPPF